MSNLEDMKPKRLDCGCQPFLRNPGVDWKPAMDRTECVLTEAVDAIRALIIECVRAGENSTNPVVLSAVGFLAKNGWSYMEWATDDREPTSPEV